VATEDVLDLSNTLLRCEPCNMYNLTQLECLLNKISGYFFLPRDPNYETVGVNKMQPRKRIPNSLPQ